MCNQSIQILPLERLPSIHLVNDIHKPTRQSMQFADQMKLKAPLKPIDPCCTSKIHIEV